MKHATKLLLITALLLPLPAQADTVYMLDLSVGGLTASGKITTDGFIGVFPDSTCCLPPHFLDWGITVSSPGQSKMLSFANSYIGGVGGGALSATPTQLLWNFDAPNGFLDFASNTQPGASLQFGPNGFIALTLFSLGSEDHRSGWQVIGDVSPLSAATAVPIPGVGFPAFLLVSLIAWWRRL